jgi:hypothetical protein
MDHWTSHAFHAVVLTPRGMYDDVTMGFSDGFITFAGRPLRNWRTWTWIGLVVRLALLVAGLVALAAMVAPVVVTRELTSVVVLRASALVGAWAVALWIAGTLLRRGKVATRARQPERVSKVPVGDVSTVSLSGRTLALRAPFDQQNRSGRWRMKLDSHDQGESLLALIGRR